MHTGKLENVYITPEQKRSVEKTFRELFRVYQDCPQCQTIGICCSPTWWNIVYNTYRVHAAIELRFLPFECTPFY